MLKILVALVPNYPNANSMSFLRQVRRLGQLQSTLKSLDNLLAESEKAVRSTFNATILQARRNFYFAMGVNVLVVLVGLVLIILAITQLINDPDKLQSWIVPGGAGVLGILINMGFNNPRRNAREDLATLMNVNIIFLGFLRQLNEIDATFKYAYIQSDKFGTDHMRQTVDRIEKTMARTLNMAARHLNVSLPTSEDGEDDRTLENQSK